MKLKFVKLFMSLENLILFVLVKYFEFFGFKLILIFLQIL